MPNFKAHCFKLTAQLMIPKTQHLNSLFGQKLIALFISSALVWKSMSATIELDRKFYDRTEEIEKVNAARILSAKFEFDETAAAQQTPQFFFGVSGLCA